jgi:hypothetical protein
MIANQSSAARRLQGLSLINGKAVDFLHQFWCLSVPKEDRTLPESAGSGGLAMVWRSHITERRRLKEKIGCVALDLIRTE